MNNIYDVIIIGGGPAGLTAAIYLTRARYRVLVLEKEKFGGQITITHEVVNYPGVGVCSGKELTDMMYRQAEYFGAEFLLAEATKLNLKEDIKEVHTNKGVYKTLGVLLATGAHPRTVGFKGEEEFKGRGVAYCATCDGEFFTGKEIFVIGGGFAAAEESIFLTKFASHVTILVRGDDFSCAKSIADEVRNHEKITVLTNTVVEEVKGDNVLNYIRYKNTKTGEVIEYSKDNDNFGVFVFVGYSPETKLVDGIAELNEQGYIVTDKSLKTNIPGLYAAGDICIKPLRQVVTATSDGALAATELEKYVAEVQRKTGIKTVEPKINKEVLKEHNKSETKSSNNELFTKEMQNQLNTVFNRMNNPLNLKLYLDNSSTSKELQVYIDTLTNMTDKITKEIISDKELNESPCVKVYHKDGNYSGLAFHGVPGGHEFTSFVLGLYNASGPGQPLDEDIKKRILNIKKNIDIKILVSLSCTMCPDLVIATQHIAAISNNITTEVYDINIFEEYKNKYNVMSVPCMIINDKNVYFGKKNIDQVLEIIENL